MKDDLNILYEKAYALPTAKYITVNRSGIIKDNIAFIDHVGVTNHSSKYPIIATSALETCIGLALYNKKTKTAGLAHLWGSNNVENIKVLIDKVMKNDSDFLEAHVVGCNFYPDEGEKRNFRISLLKELLGVINGKENIILKSFDIGDKPHTHAFAINSKNGKLIRGGELFKIPKSLDEDLPNDLRPFREGNQWGSFDGTEPENQSNKKRHL